MKQRLLIELDALLDTRLAAVATIDPNVAVKLAKTDYRNRLSDDFELLLKDGTVINDAFKERYKNRDIDVLKVSRCTAAVLMVNEITESWSKLSIDTPFVEDIAVDVNIWPYVLDNDVSDMLVKSVMAYTSLETKVEIVRYSPKDLTPKFLDDHYTVAIMYDFNQWLNENADLLLKKRIPQFTIFAPALYFNKVPDEDFLRKENITLIHPFAELELVLAEFVALHLKEPSYFSIIEP